jgi:CRP-like cAMP-binding protein
MTELASHLTNSLLATLPRESLARLRPRMRPMNLPVGTVLCDAGQHQDLVYFPVACNVSLLLLTAQGASVEVALIGREGVLGMAAFMGGRRTATRAVVECAGLAFALPASVLLKEFEACHEARAVMLRYTQARIMQVAQIAVCNRYHTIEQQFARRLLVALDSQPGNQIKMTQELIANLLGVRREGVTEAAGRLRQLEVISYRRGSIVVLDRARLEELSCECYSVVKSESGRLLSCPMAFPSAAAL